MTFEAQQSSSTATSSSASSYVVVSRSTAATTEQTNEASAKINWDAEADSTQLQAPVGVLPNDSTSQQPSLAEQTGLVVTL